MSLVVGTLAAPPRAHLLTTAALRTFGFTGALLRWHGFHSRPTDWKTPSRMPLYLDAPTVYLSGTLAHQITAHRRLGEFAAAQTFHPLTVIATDRPHPPVNLPMLSPRVRWLLTVRPDLPADAFERTLARWERLAQEFPSDQLGVCLDPRWWWTLWGFVRPRDYAPYVERLRPLVRAVMIANLPEANATLGLPLWTQAWQDSPPLPMGAGFFEMPDWRWWLSSFPDAARLLPHTDPVRRARDLLSIASIDGRREATRHGVS